MSSGPYPAGWPGEDETPAHKAARERHESAAHGPPSWPKGCSICHELMALEAWRVRAAELLAKGRLVRG